MISDVSDFFLPSSFFLNNRSKLLERLPEIALAVVFAGKAVSMSEDSEYRFFANRNFYYLTGIEQEESVLVMYKNKNSVRTVLFVQPEDELKERWNGKRIRMAVAQDRSGIRDVYYLPAMDDFLQPFLSDDALPVALEENLKHGPGKAFEKAILSLHKEREIISIGPVLARLRMVKEACEVDMIRKAIALTDEAIREMAAFVRPDVTELTLYSSFDFALARRGCLVPAFPSIIAAGKNALYLHHMNPTGKAMAGELIQIDVGGRVAGLCADISRVFPADGSFSERQRTLYAAVRACQNTAFSVIRPGCYLADLNNEVRNTAKEALESMGVLPADQPAEADVTTYYWHNVSHHLGHDVHDLCIREAAFEPGMVLTVEPGIYIPEWGIGFRIEDMVLVTEGGCEILSQSIPREWNEICDLTACQEEESRC